MGELEGRLAAAEAVARELSDAKAKIADLEGAAAAQEVRMRELMESQKISSHQVAVAMGHAQHHAASEHERLQSEHLQIEQQTAASLAYWKHRAERASAKAQGCAASLAASRSSLESLLSRLVSATSVGDLADQSRMIFEVKAAMLEVEDRLKRPDSAGGPPAGHSKSGKGASYLAGRGDPGHSGRDHSTGPPPQAAARHRGLPHGSNASRHSFLPTIDSPYATAVPPGVAPGLPPALPPALAAMLYGQSADHPGAAQGGAQSGAFAAHAGFASLGGGGGGFAGYPLHQHQQADTASLAAQQAAWLTSQDAARGSSQVDAAATAKPKSRIPPPGRAAGPAELRKPADRVPKAGTEGPSRPGTRSTPRHNPQTAQAPAGRRRAGGEDKRAVTFSG